MTIRYAAALALGAWAVSHMFLYIQRLNDPLDYLSLYVSHQPKFSLRYFDGMDAYDPVSYADAMHAIREFSRVYQTSFLADIDPLRATRRMAQQRRLLHRHLHTLRHYLPNDIQLTRRLLVGLEHTDGGMAACMDDVSRRFPEVRLAYGAGVLQQGPRAVDDTWT